ncbi:HAAS signaling domain-containing protein [Saccharothrix coeruleofusca]|uniref:Uncharacterized protein n=1 Tax=Saccharothrix coeruleofusca TaxID=33919 RepID=A0A918ATD5_9PSEU|nr:hypothetical protein [Saccharothrix coeruleofusca]MBP2336830.1 putative membrane protein [Saccharothrix coeruleofusca]GGP82871.1 hypothetical protein GCM10010185_66160 [Saccharothrix coeruleofusca]
MNTQTNTEVQRYLDRMRAALSDLPAVEVGEIMDDAGSHVVEVAEELGDEFSAEALAARLGSPEAYARELRAAAGYPPAAAPASTGGGGAALARFCFYALVAGVAAAFAFAASGGEHEQVTFLVAVCGLIAVALLFGRAGLVREVGNLPEASFARDAIAQAERSEAARVLAYLRTLQPGWWLLRALVILAAGFLLGISEFLVLALPLTALALLSGPRAKRDRRWLWISLPIGAFALGLFLTLFDAVFTHTYYRASVPQATYSATPDYPDNIYVFDKNGKALTDVYLYDEDGQPLESPWYGCASGVPRADNQYPKPQVERDGHGCREVDGVPFAVVIPTPTTSAPPTTTGPVPPSSPLPPSSESAPPATTGSVTTTG